ncbi:MAG: PRD domain-containing protein [Gemmiger sp.]
MRALRKLSNNAVICTDSSGREMVAMGKGVGFGQLPRELSLADVERTFYNMDNSSYALIQELPTEVVEFSARIIDIAANELPYELSPNAVLSLADHIAFAMERAKKQLHVRMPLAYDVQQMYPTEYKIGRYTLDRVRKEFHIGLPKEEAAGIAMNLINAKAKPEQRVEQDEAEACASMLEDITEIVENHFHLIVDRESFNFSRYATHLQYLFQRVRSQQSIESDNLQMYKSLREEYPDVADCVEKISAHMAETWHCELSEEEKLYLILHVN